MRLDVNKSYYIDSDSTQFTIFEKSVVKKGDNIGKESEKAIGYVGSLDSAFKFLIDRTVKTSTTINDMKQVIIEVRQMKEEILKALEPLKGGF